jgi:hypothetical protein
MRPEYELVMVVQVCSNITMLLKLRQKISPRYGNSEKKRFIRELLQIITNTGNVDELGGSCRTDCTGSTKENTTVITTNTNHLLYEG